MDLQSDIEQRLMVISAAVEGADIGTWYWRIETNHLEWSDLSREYLQLPEKQAPSFEHFYSVLHPADRDRVERLIRTAIDTKASRYEAEYRIVNRDGSIRWLSAPGRIFIDATGHPYAMAGVLIDITQHKLKDGMVWEALVRFQQVYEHAATGIAISDMAGSFIQCNPAFQKMLGYAEAELRRMSIAAMIHPEDRDENMAAIGQLVAGEVDQFTLINRYLHKDGRDVWVRKLGSRLDDEKGKPACLMVLVTDITDLKAVENRLAESRQLLELALSGAELGIWDTDIASGATLYDERYCAILGYSPGEMATTRVEWEALIHPDDLPAVSAAIRAHLAGDSSRYDSEHRLRHKKGHWVWVHSLGKVIRDANNRPVRATGTLEDITQRRRLIHDGTDLLEKLKGLIAGMAASTDSHENACAVATDEPPLTRRNREVLELIAKGLTSAQIARQLKISVATAETHRRNVMGKLGLKNKADVVRYAIKNRLILL